MTDRHYTPPPPGSKIIIAGGGCFGLSTAYALSLKNTYDIHVFERHPSIPALDAASHDINKIVRMDYANDTLYMHLMVEAFGFWHQWNQEREAAKLDPVFHQSGVLLLSGTDEFSEFEKSCMKTIREAGYGHYIHEYKNPEEIVKDFPQFKHAVEQGGFNTAYLNRAGGWCNSTEAVKHIYEKCKINGVKFTLGTEGCLKNVYCDPKNPQTVVGIQTMDDQIHYADRVLVSAGSWTAGVVDMQQQVVASGQQVIQFSPPKDMREQWSKLPVWCGNLSATGFYGFPCNKDGKMKIGKHHSGYLNPRKQDGVSVPRTQVTHKEDTLPIGALRDFRQFLGNFLPETSSLDISYGRTCWYSDSIDGDFVISPHPEYKNLIVAAGDSGHGLKFIPVIGFKIRDIIEGIDTQYSRAWAWRDMKTQDTKLDGLRADALLQRLILCEEGNQDARMCTPQDFKASRPRL